MGRRFSLFFQNCHIQDARNILSPFPPLFPPLREKSRESALQCEMVSRRVLLFLPFPRQKHAAEPHRFPLFFAIDAAKIYLRLIHRFTWLQTPGPLSPLPPLSSFQPEASLPTGSSSLLFFERVP